MTHIGFVGATGLMGHGIAKNLVTKGFPLSFVLRSPSDRVADLAAAGAVEAAGYAELGSTCDVVVLCVTSSADVEAVVTGGLLAAPRAGLIIIDTSTSEPSSTLRLAGECAAKGVRYVDAPLTLGPAQAEAGTLNVIVGADDALYEEVRPVIEAFAGFVVRSGGLGTGHTLKLLNNFVVFALASSLAEAFAVAAKAGLDPQSVVDILGVSSLNSPLLHNMAKTLRGDYTGMRFQLDNARKDLRYYTRLAGEKSAVTPVGAGVHEALALASALGYGDEFVPSMVKAQAQLNDVQIAARD